MERPYRMPEYLRLMSWWLLPNPAAEKPHSEIQAVTSTTADSTPPSSWPSPAPWVSAASLMRQAAGPREATACMSLRVVVLSSTCGRGRGEPGAGESKVG